MPAYTHHMSGQINLSKLSLAGVLVTLGIIFGDIGTSPLYVLKSIVGSKPISEELIFGAISCIFWTLTLQTTFKYIIITLQADNHGEGGIFSLYALVRRFGKKLYLPAMIGAAALLADGMITPAISVASSIEGLTKVDPTIPVIPIVIVILCLIFFIQQFGTSIVGKAFGPIMLVWFTMLFVLGFTQITHYPSIINSINPLYGIKLLLFYPKGFWLIGAVFLATTGAEALYSDLGHCGKQNIQASWVFVKITLVVNYLGQGAWSLHSGHAYLGNLNPFYEIMPDWFLYIGIGIATLAAIIASQALISGSFTLINEAIALNFWPRLTVKFPSTIRGQIYIPAVNWSLLAGSIFVMLWFKDSDSMVHAYGFSITIAMLMTTLLMAYYLRYIKKTPFWIVGAIITIFVIIELLFFTANITKLSQSWMLIIIQLITISIMYVWFTGRKVNNKFLNFVNLIEYIPLLKDLSNDETVPKFCTHLVYLTKADNTRSIEEKMIYSIFSHRPKRADIYWFVHLERTDDPYTREYSVVELEDDKVIRVEFRLGFRIQGKINSLFRKVIDDLVKTNEINITSRYPSLEKHNISADFRFVVLEKFLSYENVLKTWDGFLLNSYFFIKKFAVSESKSFGLDSSETYIEKIPFLVAKSSRVKIKRIYPEKT